jgi:NAD(P)-dependent dehydrogenase (short-subunit alcohol dehydrogenase family)
MGLYMTDGSLTGRRILVTGGSMTAEQLAAHDAQLTAVMPIDGRLGEVDRDLVPLLRFLAGTGSRFITGQLFPVDGGVLMVR